MAALENRDAELSARRSFQEETHMKWSLWAAVTMLTLAANLAPAAEPRLGYGGANWWARYNTPPVNQEQVSTAGPAPVVVDPAPLAAYDSHGSDYVYYPGICDNSAPCTDWLWAGYSQNPKRCNPHFMRGCQRGSCGTCSSCANCANCGCSAPSCGCAAAAPAEVPGKLVPPQPLPDIDAAVLPRATLGQPRGNVR
jgi:hypothetical protein